MKTIYYLVLLLMLLKVSKSQDEKGLQDRTNIAMKLKWSTRES